MSVTLLPNGRATGWVRDQPDPRDHRFAVNRRAVGDFPANFSLLDDMPPRLDQLDLGSCTVNSASYLYDFELGETGRPFLGLSRLFQYYVTRILEGTVNWDSGASIRNAVKSLADFGAIPESDWPYIISKYRQRPSDDLLAAALVRQLLEYKRVQQLQAEIMGAIYTRHPVEYGMAIYSQFVNVGTDGIMQMPNFQRDQLLGHHSGCLTGWRTMPNGMIYLEDDNTWGVTHGKEGIVWIPASYVLNPDIADDFWLFEVIEGEAPPTPPPPPFDPPPHVGDDIKRLMDRFGDTPLHREGWSVNEDGDNVGWSLIHTWNPINDTYHEYKYLLSNPRRIFRNPIPREQVFVL